MSKKTQAAAIIEALLARGEHEVNTRATRYRTFSRQYIGDRNSKDELVPVRNVGQYWFVSDGGGLRHGRHYVDSFSCGTAGKAQLLKEGGYHGKT